AARAREAHFRRYGRTRRPEAHRPFRLENGRSDGDIRTGRSGPDRHLRDQAAKRSRAQTARAMGKRRRMSLVLFGHPFSSYTWKVLIPLYADGTEFEFRQVPENEENYAELKRIWLAGKFPLLLDDGEPVIETTPIIEPLQAIHRG